ARPPHEHRTSGVRGRCASRAQAPRPHELRYRGIRGRGASQGPRGRDENM
ncbi:MAG: hypothetical protein AVDCRST_MAG01-01-4702, partial [uncultured Rubrobacteraceae bacterium]